MGVKVAIQMPPPSAFAEFERQSVARLKRAALNGTQIAAEKRS